MNRKELWFNVLQIALAIGGIWVIYKVHKLQSGQAINVNCGCNGAKKSACGSGRMSDGGKKNMNYIA